jgi:uncharacterized membrane protein
MGQGFGAIFPIVVIGVVADLLVNALLGVEIMGPSLKGRWLF